MNYQSVLQQYPQQIKVWWQQSPNNSLKNVIKVIAIGLFALILMFATAPNHRNQQVIEKAKLISTIVGQVQNSKPNLNLLGLITSPHHSTLTSAVNAQVTQVLVEQGDSVNKDQLLIQLSDQDYQLKLQQLSSQIQDLNAQLASNKLRQIQARQQLQQQQTLVNLAQRKEQRQQRLRSDSLVSQNLYDEAKSALALQQLALGKAQFLAGDLPLQNQRLNAQRQRLQAQQQQATLELQRCQIRAPFDGKISQIFIAQGARSFTGTKLLSLYDRSRLEVTAQIPVSALPDIKSQQSLSDAIPAQASIDGQLTELRLSRLAAQVNPGASGVDAFFKFSQPPGIEVGRSINLLVNLPEQKNVVLLPITSVYGNNHIFIVEQERLRSLPVTVIGEKISAQGELLLLLRSQTDLTGKIILTTALPQAVTGLKVKLEPSNDTAIRQPEAASKQ